jgi:hypothetical protein
MNKIVSSLIILLLLLRCTTLEKGAKPKSCFNRKIELYNQELEGDYLTAKIKLYDEYGNTYPLESNLNYIKGVFYFNGNEWIETTKFSIETKKDLLCKSKKMCVLIDNTFSMSDKIRQVNKAVELLITLKGLDDEIAIIEYGKKNKEGVKSFYKKDRLSLLKLKRDEEFELRAHTSTWSYRVLKFYVDKVEDNDMSKTEHVVFFSDFSGLTESELGEVACIAKERNIIVHRVIYSTVFNDLFNWKNSKRKRKYIMDSDFGPIYTVKCVTDLPKVINEIKKINCSSTTLKIKLEKPYHKYKVIYGENEELIIEQSIDSTLKN